METILAQEKDVGEIMQMITRCVQHMESQGIFQWNEYYPNTEILESDIAGGSAYIVRDRGVCVAYVAMDGEQAAEYAAVQWHTDGRKVLVIHRLSVHPDHQGKGIARHLLGTVEELAHQGGYTSIRLDAFSANPIALGLYERYGFQRVGQIFFPHRDLPFYCFEKAVNAPS